MLPFQTFFFFLDATGSRFHLDRSVYGTIEPWTSWKTDDRMISVSGWVPDCSWARALSGEIACAGLSAADDRTVMMH